MSIDEVPIAGRQPNRLCFACDQHRRLAVENDPTTSTVLRTGAVEFMSTAHDRDFQPSHLSSGAAKSPTVLTTDHAAAHRPAMFSP